jgi:hypothetical protein
MKTHIRSIARLVSLVSLIGTMVPPILFVMDRVSLQQVHGWMLIATVTWFASASLWMEH